MSGCSLKPRESLWSAPSKATQNRNTNSADMYFHGEGVPQNDTEALLWFRKAADQGNAKAQYGIGYMYHNGKGVPQSDAEALIWYLKSANQGDAKAQISIGAMYYYGQGVAQDYTESLRWYRLAADQGDAIAEDGIAYIYLYGHGVTRTTPRLSAGSAKPPIKEMHGQNTDSASCITSAMVFL